MNRYAVFGAPVAHSLSPLIHQAFAKQAKITLSYDKMLTQPGALKDALQQFKLSGGQGANITLPLKIEAFELCDKLSLSAQQAKAVNTIYWEEDVLCGDNTDGEGLKGYLSHHLNLNLRASRMLILGAGGAVRGILHALLSLSPQEIVIVNRTLDKAQEFAIHPLIKIYSYDTFKLAAEEGFFIVINATSLSLQAALPPIAEKWLDNTIALDLAYHQHHDTIFQQWAMKHHAKQTHDGIGMLVWQAALSFQRWHHYLPETASVIQQLHLGSNIT